MIIIIIIITIIVRIQIMLRVMAFVNNTPQIARELTDRYKGPFLSPLSIKNNANATLYANHNSSYLHKEVISH